MTLFRKSTIILMVMFLTSLAPCAFSQETEIPGVTAKLVELRQFNGVLRLEIVPKNPTAKAATGDTLFYSQVAIVDAQSNEKEFPSKGPDGHYFAGPVSDWNSGGRWYPRIEAGSEARIWIYFEPLPVGRKVSVQVPHMFPFDDVVVKEGPPASTTDAQGTLAPLNAHLVAVKHAPGELKLQLKITNPAKVLVSAPTILYEDVYLLDPKNKTRYSVMKDTNGEYQAQPISDKNSGGRWYVPAKAGSVSLMSLMFSAPPDSVQQVDLIMPGFAPIEGINISAKTTSAGNGGAAAPDRAAISAGGAKTVPLQP